MCGLLGFASVDTNARPSLPILTLLMLANESRGGHACGIGSPVLYFKQPLTSGKFISHKGFADVAQGSNLLIGHTRFGTHGTNTAQNAHPFYFQLKDGSFLVGAHNGVLSDHKAVSKAHNLPAFSVDSEALFAALAKTNNDLTIIPDIEGSKALTWVVGGKLFLYRDCNPLHYAHAPNGIYWSSEAAPLKMAGFDTIEQIDPYTVYCLGGNGLEVVQRFEAPKVKYEGRNWLDYRDDTEYTRSYHRNWERTEPEDTDPFSELGGIPEPEPEVDMAVVLLHCKALYLQALADSATFEDLQAAHAELGYLMSLAEEAQYGDALAAAELAKEYRRCCVDNYAMA